MAPKHRRRFKRTLGERRYRKLFIIAAEGVKTEPQYFAIFNYKSIIRVNCLKGNHDSSPPQVLKRMEGYLRNEGLKKSDEAWLVVDKDHWTDSQLQQLYEWSQRKDNYGFALSNPKFEYWLLLHFDEGTGITSSRDCMERLTRYLPDYDKGLDARKITGEMITAAARRARMRDTPPCMKWPHLPGCTTVYKLVESILQSE